MEPNGSTIPDPDVNDSVVDTDFNGVRIRNDSTYMFTWGSLVSLNYTLPAMVAVAVVLLVVIIATAFGNLLVGLSLFKYRYLRTISNYLIGNLAVSDFLLATTILPLSVINECLGHWVFGQAICKLWLVTDVLYCTASLWNLCVIAFDRFNATLYPMWYRENRSTKQAAIYMVLVWSIALAICVPPLFGWNDLSETYLYDNTTDVYRCELFRIPSYVLYSACGSFFIPFAITLSLYISILISLRRRMRRMPMKVPSAKASSGVKNNSVISVSTTVTAISGYKNLQSCPTAGKADRDRFGPVNSKSSQTVEMTGLPTNWNKSGLLTSGWKADEINSSKSFSDLDCDEDDQIQPSHIGVMTKSVTEADFVETVTAQNINGSRNMLGHFQDLNKAFDSESAPITTDDKISNNKDIRENPAEDNNSKRRSKFLNPFRSNKKLRGTFTQQRGFEQRELKATIRMAIIIAFFCGMWIGFFTLYVIQGCCPKSTCFIPRQLDAFFFWLGYSNSSINPILYTIFNDEFRKAFIKILGCTLHRRTAGDPRASSSNSRIT